MNDDTERAGLIARWRKVLAERLKPTGPIAANHATELAEFHERLDQLRTLAETTSDPLRSSGYEQLWRTMGEELEFIASDLDRGQISPAELPDKLQTWSDLGLTYLHTQQDHPAIEKILDPRPTDEPAERGEQAYTVELGQGRLLEYLRQQAEAAATAGRAEDAAQLDRMTSEVAFEAGSIENAAAWNDDPITDLAARRAADRDAFDSTVHQLARTFGVDIPENLADSRHTSPTGPDDAARMQREARIEQSIRNAYDLLTVRAEEAGEQPRWIRLADLRAELTAPASGTEPYSRDEVDAALRRLTHAADDRAVHVIPEDADWARTAADDAAAVYFGGTNRHQIYIEDPAAEQATPTSHGSGEPGLVTDTAYKHHVDTSNPAPADSDRVDGEGELSDDEMRAMTAELVVDPYDDVVVAGVVMSRAEAAELSEPWFAGDADELDDDENLIQDGHLDGDLDRDSRDRLSDDEMRAMTAELVVDPYDDVVVAGVVMSRAEAAELSEPWFAGDADELADDQTNDQESNLAGNNAAGDLGDTPERAGSQADASSSGDIASAIDTSACAAAVSRAAISADITSRHVAESESASAQETRDEQLAVWSHDDRVVQDQAIEKNNTAVGDDSPSW